MTTSAERTPGGTGGRVRAGIKWAGVSLLATKSARFLTNIVLARLLAPEAFGLLAMANGVIMLLRALREAGFGHAYIQRLDRGEEDSRRAVDTTFVVTLVINASLFVLAEAFTPQIRGIFRGDPELESVLRWMFAVLLLDALFTTPSYILQKRLAFAQHSRAEVAGTAASAVTAIGLAFLGFGVWSLVAAQLVSRTIEAAMMVAMTGWRPTFRFSPSLARELFAFGKYMWAFAILSAVGGILDRVILGRNDGAAALGGYWIALNLCKMPSTQLSFLVNRISFPVLSQLQLKPERLRRAFRKALSHVSVVSFPMAFGLLAVSELFVPIAYGEKWRGVVPIVDVLAFYGMTLAVSSVAGPALKAVGKANAMFYSSVAHHVLQVTLLLTLGQQGVIWVAVSILIPLVASSVMAFWLVRAYVHVEARDMLEPVMRSGISAMTMWLIVEAFQRAVGGWPPIVTLLASGAIGVGAYWAASMVWNRPMMREFARTVRDVISSRGQPA